MRLGQKIEQCQARNEVFYSFEFFPPKTAAGVENLYSRMDRMAALEPLFCNMTCGTVDPLSTTLKMSCNAQQYCGLEMVMHVTCTNQSKDDIRATLNAAKEAGIRNIMALRGELGRKPNPDSTTLDHASDLVNLVTEEYGSHTFSIGVAGHPEKHADAPSLEEDIGHLKAKVDAGADFVITQFFYDASAFFHFRTLAQNAGVNVPIIPGIMPIQNYKGFLRMTSFCDTVVPESIMTKLKDIKDDDQAVKQAGIQIIVNLCKELIAGGVPGLHFYTLNLERSVRKILNGLGLTDDASLRVASDRREFPWRSSSLSSRATESVRPIFWANRPTSYISRTSSWDTDEFSNGRWGDNKSPAFGELSDSHYAPFSRLSVPERHVQWGESLENVKDVAETFVRYITGKVPSLPWCESALDLETASIQTSLIDIIRRGFLTINSQPQVNGVPSDDRLFGWGGSGGRVYQKAYVECFVSPENLGKLMSAIKKLNKSTIQYHAVDVRGNSYSNRKKGTTAVTWGVFPNKEILQPTVVDTESFIAWKDEAFSLWKSMWACIYADDSRSYEVLHEIYNSYFLVSVVENDFIGGDIWSIFSTSSSSTKEDSNDVAVDAAP